jgi:hypothetical protein
VRELVRIDTSPSTNSKQRTARDSDGFTFGALWDSPSDERLTADSLCTAALRQKQSLPSAHLVFLSDMPKINQRVLDARDLLIKRIAAETAAMIGGGARLVNMSQGVPCLPIFEESKAAIIDCVETNNLPCTPAADFSHAWACALVSLLFSGIFPVGSRARRADIRFYSDTDVPGLLAVRQTAAAFVNQFYSNANIGVDMKFDAANVMVTAGAIQAISNVLSLTIDCADDVVVTTLPAYGLYTHQTQMLGGTFAAMPTSAAAGFAPTARELDAFFRQFDVPSSSSSSSSSDDGGSETRSVRNRVRAVILCFPNNPTGAMLTREQAIEIADALDAELRRHPEPGFALILDEVYVGICHRQFYSILQFASPLLLASTFLVCIT